MTRDEMLAMPAGRELDALVAEKVMGWMWAIERMLIPPMDDPRIRWAAEWDNKGRPGYLPNYSTDIATAWEVVEKVYQRGLRKEYLRGLYSQGIHDLDLLAHHDAVTACRAALLAVMGVEEER